jgi:hypothetical protein
LESSVPAAKEKERKKLQSNEFGRRYQKKVDYDRIEATETNRRWWGREVKGMQRFIRFAG